MYRIIDEENRVYTLYKYSQESEFERMIVKNYESIFGKDGIYFDIKRLIGIPKKGATKPDGYYLDLTFHTDPRFYLVEVELSSHDVYGHIGEQILRFGISSETDKYKIKNILLDEIEHSKEKQAILESFFEKSAYNNVNELLDKVIFDNDPAAIIIIDEATEELSRVMGQLTMRTEVLEAQTYVSNHKKLHRFTPFKGEILTDLSIEKDADQLDTIVVPAREEGFQDEFLGNNQWFAIRISATMVDKIKYIAAYQVSPISAITHIAEVERIEKYKDTNKYIVYFKKHTLHKINRVGLGSRKNQAPQAPRYASYKTIVNASNLDDVWN